MASLSEGDIRTVASGWLTDLFLVQEHLSLQKVRWPPALARLLGERPGSPALCSAPAKGAKGLSQKQESAHGNCLEKSQLRADPRRGLHLDGPGLQRQGRTRGRQRGRCWVLKLDSKHHRCGRFRSFSHCRPAESLPVGSGDCHLTQQEAGLLRGAGKAPHRY